MKQALETLTIMQLLSKYKKLVRNAPLTLSASNAEMDTYYNKINELESEIIRRTKG